MSFIELKVLNQRTREERTCNQCGQCCNDIHLDLSPQELQDKAERGHSQAVVLVGIWEYRGYYALPNHPNINKHHYRCNKLIQTSERNKFACSIYETRPLVCRDFPFYDYATLERNLYPSQYGGCTYNIDDRACQNLEYDTTQAHYYAHLLTWEADKTQAMIKMNEAISSNKTLA